jgi:hypothetical protein
MPPAKRLLELPLCIQDTALFYPDRMDASETEAMELCRNVIRQTANMGGALTVNWHTRSLSPERLWGDFYRELLAELGRYRVWFGTASQVVGWFRERRALRFEEVRLPGGAVRVKVLGHSDGEPPFILRLHRANVTACAGSSAMPEYSDMPFRGEAELTLGDNHPAVSEVV